MVLNIKNKQVEALVSEIAALTSESETGVIRQALVERRDKLMSLRFLETEIWPRVPKNILGRKCREKRAKTY